ncbi:MAG: ThuA domain-containing protein, partial [Fimbriiglobus sp.]
MPARLRFAALLAAALAVPTSAFAPAADPDPPKLAVLFLGDGGHHKPADRFRQLEPVFAARNITLTYTEKPTDLNPATLGKYDGLVVFANIDTIAPEQEKALLEYVAGGKGFVPLHCASYCFRNSDAVVALIGGQFRSHTTGTFRVTDVAPDHPIMKGYGGFTSWDETYVHTKHNEKDRTVLEVRAEGDVKEPWTWVRTHGKGRVFYTAWGHDERTWGNPGFHNLVERGVRWACGQDPAVAGPFTERPPMSAKRTDLKPFEYTTGKLPVYTTGGKIGTENQGRMQLPLPAAESAKHYVTPAGFEVRTFVTEEKLGGKPIAMRWDERGRLWLALTMDYPN